jgi:hypothetical protein
MKIYTGGCHCGRVRVEVTTDLNRASKCNCSICSKKGYLHHMVPAERFRLRSGEDALATYQFGTRSALHHFCRHCGVASFYRPRANPSSYMINVHCLDDVDMSALQIVHFDGRSWEPTPGAPYVGPWKSNQ